MQAGRALARMGFVAGLVAVGGVRAAAPKDAPGRSWAVLAEVQRQAYADGFSAGQREAAGGARLDDCDRALGYAERRAKRAGEYEDCLKEVEAARAFGPYAVTAAMNKCIAMMPAFTS